MKTTSIVFLCLLTAHATPGVLPKRGIRGSKNHENFEREMAVPFTESMGLRNREGGKLKEILNKNRRTGESFEVRLSFII